MTRFPRSALPDGFFHVTSRGVRRTRIFLDDLDYAAFARSLERLASQMGWRLHAYCLMPNHYHAVVEAPVELLSASMQRLNGRHAQSFNARHDLKGHVFESRFQARVVAAEEHLFSACAYVRQNPVRAGLCARAEDWPWSG